MPCKQSANPQHSCKALSGIATGYGLHATFISLCTLHVRMLSRREFSKTTELGQALLENVWKTDGNTRALKGHRENLPKQWLPQIDVINDNGGNAGKEPDKQHIYKPTNAQLSASRKHVGIFGLKHEVFFLNLEDGYFGCQVNESTDYLQLYELSKLCDGTSDCYMGSDELRNKLKCTNDCDKDGTACSNGVCLDGQCHCNDGFGGCNCQVPDENECKYRPCDVFAHCTNTLGSFTCTCFPGYQGDGLHCEDIDECQDPNIAQRCVENAECCNLPAHFVCKCKPGFEGDGEERCADINECLDPQACGLNAECVNLPGNYTCQCREGYYGDPYNGCIDVDECVQPGVCGPGAICTNLEGGYRCDCPQGFDGDARSAQGCLDYDECARSPCGRNALCRNEVGSFRCECQQGFSGDPMTDCQDVDECSGNPCADGAICINSPGGYRCKCPAGLMATDDGQCTDINECAKANACGENAKCINFPGSYKCLCPQGYEGRGELFCKNIDECSAYEKPCGEHAICENASPGYNCLCPQGYVGRPNAKVACEQADVNVLCTSAFDCTNNAECIEGQCFCQDGFEPQGSVCVDIDECRSGVPFGKGSGAGVCGPSAVCVNIPGSYRCECEAGFIGTPPRVPCKPPCADVKCGKNAYCKAEGQEAFCICDEGWTFNPSDIAAGCVDIDECDPAQGPNGRCGLNAICTNHPGSYSCTCPPGFTGEPTRQCQDVDECARPGACGVNALCKNLEGSHQCSCPAGSIADPDPSVRCISIVACSKDADCPGNAVCDQQKRCLCPEPNVGNDCRHPCEKVTCGPNAHCMLVPGGGAQCLCSEGYTGQPGQCVDINECGANPCPSGAVCTNLPGGYTCQCPGGSSGDPYSGGCSKSALNACSESNPCPAGEKCILDAYSGNSVCICGQGYKRDAKGSCRDVDECADSTKAACGVNAICKNLPGSYECQCPAGFNGNPYQSCDECHSAECRCAAPYKLMDGNCVLDSCSPDGKCPGGAECISITGGVSYCACPKGFRTLANGHCEDIDECGEGQQVCGYDAICLNTIGGFECKCPLGYSGDPYHGLCTLAQKRCAADRECGANERCVQPGECVCPPPYYMDAYDGNRCKSPCERFPCGMNARCTPSDPPQCMCEVGFKGDPLTGCIDEDECANSPCAYGAQCVNQRGGYKCVCPPGMVGDAYKGGCILEQGSVKSQCRRNEDCADTLACERGTCVSPCASLLCGTNAFCEPEKHAAWCRCRAGFVEGPSGDCVSQCEGYMCGQGAMCIVSNTGPTCKCPPGEMGNPFPGGSCTTDQCSTSRPCADPQVCINGRCKHKCDGVVCGVGATCDVASGKCICEPYFVGNPELICMPPVSSPACEPSCGQNAHCEYGVIQNVCVCNPGTSGNPYGLCEPQQRNMCSRMRCGTNAECRESLTSAECICPGGYSGNPYVACRDVDECSAPGVCGEGAICINSAGSYDCRCRPGYGGNPFVMCSAIEKTVCDNPRQCQCRKNVQCPPGYSCQRGICRNLCAKTNCGPRAACDSGRCICPPGYAGNATDLKTGCVLEGQCDSDADCESSKICFQTSKGLRRCVDACSKVQCGPNALCVSNDHRSTCICAPSYVGNPGDLTVGCQQEAKLVAECKSDGDCKTGHVCTVTENGLHACVNPCNAVECGVHEACTVNEVNQPVCHCQNGYRWNPVSSSCVKPSIPDCTTDADCHQVAACRPDAVGVLKCIAVCTEFTCPPNSVCVSSNHQGSCQCLPGYTGNPNDRNGCRPEQQNTCLTSAECAESDTCILHEGALSCRPACEGVQCGPFALCITNNHNAQCQCPPGSYAGDPYDLTKGCQSVSCVYNRDCPSNQLCNRMTHSCVDVCQEDTCGENAVCIAENHRSVCQCPPGYRANPIADVECAQVRSCDPNPCHPSASCEAGPDGYVCKCPVGQIGNPLTGCRDEGACPGGDIECPEGAACVNGKCIDPCVNACGINSQCTVVNRSPVCSCKAKYVPGATGSARDGCVRLSNGCMSDLDCNGDVCHGGQCMVACRNTKDCSAGERCLSNICAVPCSAHSQCAEGQACAGGICTIGCRSSRDCSGTTACIDFKCTDPCKADRNACGPNALCSSVDHVPQCSCPAGFEGNPSPDQGCVRMPTNCETSAQCAAGHMCIRNLCSLPCTETTPCAIGERCHNSVCAKVCYTNNNCLPGEVCSEAGVCVPGCGTDADCPSQRVCQGGKCKCMKGFIGTPFGCADIDECSDEPCHSSAVCENIPGSYRCQCPEGAVGDAYANPGCRKPNQCRRDADCSDELACIGGKCRSPCSTKQCGLNAECQVTGHQAECFCPAGYLGDATDKDTGVGCFKVECVHNEDCGPDRACSDESNRCVNPCEQINCGRGTCQIVDHEATCTCYQGYAFVNGKCEDIDECTEMKPAPCHDSALCENLPGNYLCSCPAGLVGDPVTAGCKRSDECISSEDCPSGAVCIDAHCKNPCAEENVCGENALCTLVGERATCECPSTTRGDPKVACRKLECTTADECTADRTCIGYRCIDPCSLKSACGSSANCVTKNHLAICSCQPGTTGNPLLGCVPLQYCNSDLQCPTGTKCSAGVCCSLCATNRDCLDDQLCIQGVCQPTCRSNTTCPDFQYCHNGICTKEFKCRTDDECDADEMCITDSNGRSECRNACNTGRVLCGRNADCNARNHVAECECKQGFFRDAAGICRKVECASDEDCSSDKVCDNHACKIACLTSETPCGANALCSAENHQQVCYCQPGFTGDPKRGCSLIDFCKERPCAPNAKCRNSRGSYRCSCPAGLVGDPYQGGCKKAAECERDSDCPDAAECVQENGESKCRDVCANVTCGPNAECAARKHNADCKCRARFEGDPKDLTNGCKPKPQSCKRNNDCPENSYCHGQICKPACSETDECNQDEVCSSGQCINPCHEVNACGMNAECLMGAHTKQCSCPAGFTGDAAVECVRVPISCASSADCVDGSICKESMCLPRCRNDQECALNEKCLQGSCMLTCRLDNDCFLGHICLSGRCVYGCHADSDCSASETCRDNRCVNPCSENPCGPNAACTVVNHRASCSCFTGMVPSPTAKVGCVRAPALQCTENRDCIDGTSCIDRLCRPVCGNDQGCLNNERCDGGSCKPICRKDDDCRTGEICQGQTCMIGCRSDSGCSDHLACIGQQCTDPCQEPTACGTNAECVVVLHKKQCSCPGGLVGDPFNLGCRQETHLCQTRTDCPKGQACYGGTCMQTCRNDQNCLADERCVRGTCRTVCNSDAACGNGLICEGRICQAGCRSDNQCASNHACINKKCTDPCATLGQCGSCSECTVIDHGVQCSCPHGYLGNPLLSCSPPAEKCNAQCTCDEDGMYCVKSCRQAKDCGCGQTCHRGKCRTKCNPGNCPAGLLCQNGACVAGCRTSADCPSDRSCTNGKCVDPCADGKACGKNALCQVSDHRSLCLCPDGFQGDPSVGCAQYECQTNDDCELDKKCASGKCINPCLIPGACGLNAQCRVVNRQAQCSCTPGFFGNPRQECQPVQKNSCAQNPCGDNTVCREDEHGYECSCQPGCVGDPRQGCLCEGKLKKDDCEQYACGTNAVCRMTEWGAPSCVCLPTHPHGDPYMSCTQDDTAIDCRTTGCVEGECVRDGAKFICRKDESCANDLQCANDKACIGGKCSDPCSLRGACGDNALCQTVLHRPRCSCPNCYIGRPNVECKPDPKCEEVTTPRPNDPKIVSVACETNDDCHESLRCDASGQCSDPCTVPAPFVCDANKKCVSRRHRPSCVCTHGFIVNDSGELVCAPEKRECFGDDGCASNMACLEGRCLNPCFGNGKRSAPCPDDKACVVVDHRPTCVCMKDCSPSLSICLRDSGCPDELACRNYQCVNPCETTTCAEDSPCYVEDHKPICKFCPPGFVKDVRHGCLKGTTEYPEEYYDGHKIDRSDEFTTVDTTDFDTDTTTTISNEPIVSSTLILEDDLTTLSVSTRVNETTHIHNVASSTSKDEIVDDDGKATHNLFTTIYPMDQIDDIQTTSESFTSTITTEGYTSQNTDEVALATSTIIPKTNHSTAKPSNHADTLTKQDRKSTDLEDTDQQPTVTTPIDDYFVELSSTSKHYEFMQHSEATVTPLGKKSSTTSMTTAVDITTTTEQYIFDDRSLPLSTSGYDGDDYIDEDSTSIATTIETTLPEKTTTLATNITKPYGTEPTGTTAEPLFEDVQCRTEHDCNTNETCYANVKRQQTVERASCVTDVTVFKRIPTELLVVSIARQEFRVILLLEVASKVSILSNSHFRTHCRA
uniref:EGF-like domain-containing protein n=1 Tax=Anopheles culicifacies TaxID=139723 RepID=A0A182M1U8_9DIPT